MFFILLAAGAALLFMGGGKEGASGPRTDAKKAWSLLSAMNVIVAGSSKFDGPGGAPFVVLPLQPKQSGVVGMDAASFLGKIRDGEKSFWVDPDWRAIVVSASKASPGGAYQLLLAPGDAWPPKQ